MTVHRFEPEQAIRYRQSVVTHNIPMDRAKKEIIKRQDSGSRGISHGQFTWDSSQKLQETKTIKRKAKLGNGGCADCISLMTFTTQKRLDPVACTARFGGVLCGRHKLIFTVRAQLFSVYLFAEGTVSALIELSLENS